MRIIANENIHSDNIKLVNKAGTVEEISLEKALTKAYEQQSDLIQVAVDNGIPICKIGQLDKYKYELAQKEKKKRKGQKRVQVKEIRITPNIADHDLDIKLKMAMKFLEEGNYLLLKMQMRGRETSRASEHKIRLETIADRLSGYYKKRSKPVISNRVICINLKP